MLCSIVLLSASLVCGAPAPLPKAPRPVGRADVLGRHVLLWANGTWHVTFHADGTFTSVSAYSVYEGCWSLDARGVLTVCEQTVTPTNEPDRWLVWTVPLRRGEGGMLAGTAMIGDKTGGGIAVAMRRE